MGSGMARRPTSGARSRAGVSARHCSRRRRPMPGRPVPPASTSTRRWAACPSIGPTGSLSRHPAKRSSRPDERCRACSCARCCGRQAMPSRLFGPSKSEIWRQLSEAIGGEYSDSGWGARRGVVRATHGVWTVTLDTFVVMAGNTPVPFTRMRAPFVSQTGFRFSIRRRSLLTDVAAKLGMQDLEIGDEAFDRAFVIKGTEPTLVQELFADAQV